MKPPDIMLGVVIFNLRDFMSIFHLHCPSYVLIFSPFKFLKEQEWSSWKTTNYSWFLPSMLQDHLPRTIYSKNYRLNPRLFISLALTIFESKKLPINISGTVIFSLRDFMRIFHLQCPSYVPMVSSSRSLKEHEWSSLKTIKWLWCLPSLLQAHFPRTIFSYSSR